MNTCSASEFIIHVHGLNYPYQLRILVLIIIYFHLGTKNWKRVWNENGKFTCAKE